MKLDIPDLFQIWVTKHPVLYLDGFVFGFVFG